MATGSSTHQCDPRRTTTNGYFLKAGYFLKVPPLIASTLVQAKRVLLSPSGTR